MKDDDFKLLMVFALGQTDERTDICECRVAFATENFSIEKIASDMSLDNIGVDRQ